MMLSMTSQMAEYQSKLRALRKSREACGQLDRPISVGTTFHGLPCDLTVGLSKARLRATLEALIDHEIAEITRSIEAHGVVVDE